LLKKFFDLYKSKQINGLFINIFNEDNDSIKSEFFDYYGFELNTNINFSELLEYDYYKIKSNDIKIIKINFFDNELTIFDYFNFIIFDLENLKIDNLDSSYKYNFLL
jgi:hypothetical protein